MDFGAWHLVVFPKHCLSKSLCTLHTEDMWYKCSELSKCGQLETGLMCVSCTHITVLW